ncbi:MAG TPA: WYL domain-containing protein [Oscillatoriaceae cyanobacterium M33_DOE_052]|uniref:WYL domain-containing protein n=1 Tax=Planktothricoides sp. SpSt-374 TaxID=2282167 RepID=A0A7C3ZZN1_9CYAN|nr:WYL domain-containing protein [Oscillatoriaceae cyanobacterium M33_DOE_052]
MPRKKQTITLSVAPGTKESLESIARRLGIFWGKKPSPSGLIAAIAQQELEVGEPFTLTGAQIRALRQASRSLTDAGFIPDAQTITQLLLERGNLQPPVRQELLQQVGQPTEAWRLRVDRLIADRQPFHLLYRRKDGEQLEYTVRYAEINQHERRMYLDIWCEETEDSTSIPELRHNRCLRLDKISAIIPVTGEWRSSLDSVKVHLHCWGGLAHNYEVKEEEDVENEKVGDLRRVVKRIANTFWLFRELRPYGADCEIVSPENVRALYKEDLIKTCQRYGITTHP